MTTRLTIDKINKYAKELYPNKDYRLERMGVYFMWWEDGNYKISWYGTVKTVRLNDLTLDMWIRELELAIEKSNT